LAYSFSAFENAVGVWLGSPELTARLRQAVRRVLGQEPEDTSALTYDQAAGALLLALLGDRDPPELRSVVLSAATGKMIVLDGDQARQHPLTAEWAGKTPTAYIAQTMRNGALLIGEGEELTTSHLCVTEWREAVYATILTTAGQLGAFAEYGPAPDADALQITRRIATETLRSIGYHAATQTVVTNPVAPAADVTSIAIH
jgi:hypothetical protein